MPYWSSALRMWSLKSIKTPGMLWKSSVRGERRLGVVLHACSRALVSQVKTKKKKKHTSDCKKTKDSFVLRNEHLKEKKHWRRWENVSCEWGIFLHNLTFSYKCMFLCSPSLTVQQNRASNYAFREKVLYLLLWTPSVRQVFCRKNPPLHSKWCVYAPSSSNGTLFGNKYRKNWALTMEGNSQHCRSFKETQQKSHFQNMVWMTSDPGKYSGKKTPQFERLVAKMWAKDERKTRFLRIATWKRTLSRLKRI